MDEFLQGPPTQQLSSFPTSSLGHELMGTFTFQMAAPRSGDPVTLTKFLQFVTLPSSYEPAFIFLSISQSPVWVIIGLTLWSSLVLWGYNSR